MRKIRVLIVDDSLLIRNLFSDILNSSGSIEVIGTASDPLDAREKIKILNPDVITLDIEMPKMDGITFLEKIMTLRPMPVVMASSLTQHGADATIRALELGAVDFIPKTDSTNFDADELSQSLIDKVIIAARTKVKPLVKDQVVDNTNVSILAKKLKGKQYSKDIIAIGSSTGGVEAIKDIVSLLPSCVPPIVITQHMPPKFTKSFAERMDGLSELDIFEAKDGEELVNGCAYIAPGDFHLKVIRKPGKYIVNLDRGEKVTGHRPSVDVMFESVSRAVNSSRALGIILTGMGKDGAMGMMALKKIDAVTIGQDESSCTVYGMPKAAYLAGAVDEQVHLDKIAEQILQHCT